MQYQADLQKYWGFSEFRAGQEQAVKSIIAGRDVLVIFPTGSGKSLCYQLAGLSLPHLTIVISPLLALMADQVSALQRKNISAAAWTSQTTLEEKRKLMRDIENHKLKFLYLSPEKLLSPVTWMLLKTVQISQVVVDEAHCVSQWSGEFRPHYGKIPLFIERYSKYYPRPFVSAFTATATPTTAQEIKRLLKLNRPRVIALPFLRSHLKTTIIPVESEAIKRLRMLEVLRWWDTQDGCCLIYAATRRETEWISQWLTLCGFPSDYFHAGRPYKEKQAILQKYLENPHGLLVATNAFGLGVDKPNIRVVLHHTAPVSLEAYAQEAGRAGRDGKTAWPIMFFSSADLARNFSFTSRGKKSPQRRKRIWNQACSLLDFAEKANCYRRFLYEYFLLQETQPVLARDVPACGCGKCSDKRPWETLQSKNTETTQYQKFRDQEAKRLNVPKHFLGSNDFLQKIFQEPSTQNLHKQSGSAFPRVRWLTSVLKPVQ